MTPTNKTAELALLITVALIIAAADLWTVRHRRRRERNHGVVQQQDSASVAPAKEAEFMWSRHTGSYDDAAAVIVGAPGIYPS